MKGDFLLKKHASCHHILGNGRVDKDKCLCGMCVFSCLFPEPYAIMPPLELFMEVSYEERKSTLYRDLERGDIVVGRINNIREYGFFLTLLCMAGGLRRDIEDLELSVCEQVKLTECICTCLCVCQIHCVFIGCQKFIQN